METLEPLYDSGDLKYSYCVKQLLCYISNRKIFRKHPMLRISVFQTV